MEPITFTTHITEDDYAAAGFHMTSRYLLRRIGPWYGLLIVVVVANNLREHGLERPLMILFMPAVLTLVTAIMLWRVKHNLRKSHRENFRVQAPITYTINVEQCVQSGESFRLDIPWKNVVRVEHWKGAYLLHMTKKLAHFIPPGAFSSEQEQRFRELLDRVKPGWR